MKKAMIMDIQRYSIHDGPGIRTTVFFKGCHMDCKWCHNPESQRQSSEMLFYEERCIGCGACLSLCHQKAHRIEKGRHRVELALCRECSRMEICAENCPAQAMQMCGREMEAEELLEKVLADRDFYGEEGGVTCSGGEALLQGAFLLEFLSLCKAEGISTCLDTTLNVPWEEVERLLPFTDLFLVDIKFMDPKKHMQYCGTEGILTVENLYRLAKRGKRVILRMPILSGINDTKSEVRERRKLLADLPNVERVDCFAVTGHGAGKYRALQREFIPFHENVDLEKLARDMQKRMAGERPGERKSMVRLKFEKGIGEEAVCKSTDNRIHFVMNREPFQHRKCLFYEEALLFDGYSVWFEDTGSGLCFEKDFSLSFFLAPFGYSSKGDGLFSCFDTERREGLCVVLEKQGRVRVEFGNGGILFAFTSLNVHVQKNRWNMVTVVFWQEAGWCDLYVNGILSNRKQFPRHMELRWPGQKTYLGKYVDQGDNRKVQMSGCFYGLMREVLMQEEPLKKEQIKELYAAFFTGERESTGIEPHEEYPYKGEVKTRGLDRSIYEGDVQRPMYHLIPPGKWMNEPHGPLYFRGYYHIFYQANPHAPVWDHIQWGHMISRDMVHWEDLALALETEEDIAPDGCWSGSSLVDKEGRPRIFYTAGDDNCFPNQFVATAQAVMDPENRLCEWKKSKDPVVTQTKGWLGEFRDPFVWLEKDTYFMLVGTGDEENGGGNAILYSSDDLENWRMHGFFLDYDYGKNREVGHVFELPVLLPLRDEKGETVCHIFLFCACQIEGHVVETYFFCGRWNPDEGTFEKYHEKAMLLDLGRGVFTGPSGFVTPDGRTVVFTIAQGKRGAGEEFYAGWAHNGGLPVELFVQNQSLRIRPIREIYGLRKRKLLHLTDVSMEEANRALTPFSGNRFWMKVRAQARLLLLETLDGDRRKTIYYDREESRLGVLDEEGREAGGYRGHTDRVDMGREPVSMEYFLDHSMIEVYLNERKSVTTRNYIRGKERKLKIDGKAERILELELWEMDSAYEK